MLERHQQMLIQQPQQQVDQSAVVLAHERHLHAHCTLASTKACLSGNRQTCDVAASPGLTNLLVENLLPQSKALSITACTPPAQHDCRLGIRSIRTTRDMTWQKSCMTRAESFLLACVRVYLIEEVQALGEPIQLVQLSCSRLRTQHNCF